MRYLIVMAAVCALSCGNPPTKGPITINNDPANGDPNNVVVNNTAPNAQTGSCADGQLEASVNGELGCYDACDAGTCAAGQTCRSGICIADIVTTNNTANNTSNNTPTNAVTACSTNADCRVDQECRAAGCVDHTFCEYAEADSQCYNTTFGIWEGCDDGKTYRLECNTSEECSCIVNDTVVTTFVATDTECYEEPSYRVANRRCEWNVPKAF